MRKLLSIAGDIFLLAALSCIFLVLRVSTAAVALFYVALSAALLFGIGALKHRLWRNRLYWVLFATTYVPLLVYVFASFFSQLSPSQYFSFFALLLIAAVLLGLTLGFAMALWLVWHLMWPVWHLVTHVTKRDPKQQ